MRILCLDDVSWKTVRPLEGLEFYGIGPLERTADLLFEHVAEKFEEDNVNDPDPDVEILVHLTHEIVHKINALKAAVDRLNRECRGVASKEEEDRVRELLKMDEEEGNFCPLAIVDLVRKKGDDWALENRESLLKQASWDEIVKKRQGKDSGQRPNFDEEQRSQENAQEGMDLN